MSNSSRNALRDFCLRPDFLLAFFPNAPPAPPRCGGRPPPGRCGPPVAPAVPGGVFAVTSGLLTPILGFTPDQISIMGSFYYTQGTSNSATNNSADLYLGPILSKK